MKYESLSYLSLSAGNWQHPPKMRRGSSLLDIKKVYSLISCQYHLQSINAHIRRKAMNQVWYIIIFLHVLSVKHPTACLSLSIQHLQEATRVQRKLDLKARQEKKSYSLCFSVMSQCVIRSQELQGKMSKTEAPWRRGELSDSYPLLGIYSTKELST